NIFVFLLVFILIILVSLNIFIFLLVVGVAIFVIFAVRFVVFRLVLTARFFIIIFFAIVVKHVFNVLSGVGSSGLNGRTFNFRVAEFQIEYGRSHRFSDKIYF